jgi:Subtilase family
VIRTASRGLVAGLAAVAAGLWAAAAPAAGEVGAPAATVQAIAADAQFLEYAPPPAAPGVVCLIDSGVDPNPDTTPILAGSYAMEPGTDTDDELSKLNPPIEPGNHPDGHGTYMAMIMAAPVNGWGMVGIAPTSVRVYNVKALGAGQTTFTFTEYANAIVHCASEPIGVSGLSVVNLSLGSTTAPTPAESSDLSIAVGDAREVGLDVVGSAGNSGAGVAYPAAVSGVLAVGATDANPATLGVLCQSSNRGPGLGLLAPGCGSQSEPGGGGGGIDVAFSDDGTPAWASGTSEASAIVSSVLASMRAYGPQLTADQAQVCVTSTAVNGGNLDAAAAFRACGLGGIVAEGLAAYRAATTPDPQTAALASPPSATPAEPTAAAVAPAPKGVDPTLPAARPRVTSVRSRAGHLAVAVAAVPRGAQVRVEGERRLADDQYRVVASTTTRGRIATLPLGHWDRVAVFFVDGSQRSAAAYIGGHAIPGVSTAASPSKRSAVER